MYVCMYMCIKFSFGSGVGRIHIKVYDLYAFKLIFSVSLHIYEHHLVYVHMYLSLSYSFIIELLDR